MNIQKFYIPINRNKLAHFFGRGVIVPSKYLEEIQKDIQDRFDSYILFSACKFTRDTDCCIEVVLNIEESLRVIQISNNFSVFDTPLAISRVTAIYFCSEEERNNTIYSITKDNGDAFIPTRLQYIAKQENTLDTAELGAYEPNPKDWSLELKKFDQLMGGFALMKLSTDGEESYTRDYFQTLGNLNKYFAPDELSHKFKNLFCQKESETSDSLSDLYSRLVFSDVNSEKVINFSRKEDVQVSQVYGDIDINSIAKDTSTYVLSVLSIYGSYGGSKTIDNFLSDFVARKIHTIDPLELPLVFGINKGYKGFSNKYGFSGVDIDVKFKLERKVDYYVIESIYQNTFNLNYVYNPVDIIDVYQDLPYEYYDTLESKVLEVKKKRKTGFFDLLPIFSQKNNKDTENYSDFNTMVREVVKFAIGSTDSLSLFVVDSMDTLRQKVTGLEERVDKAGKYITDLKKEVNQSIGAASAKSEEALASLQLKIQNSYASKDETSSLKETIEQHITGLDVRLMQEIQRIDDASTKTEDDLASLQLKVQNSYASKAETANLKHTIDQGVADLGGRLNQDIQRIDDESTKTEDALASLQSEIQNSYASKAETANLKHTIDQTVTDLERRLNQGIQRIDDVSTKSEDALTDLQLKIQNNYASKDDIPSLKEAIQQNITGFDGRLTQQIQRIDDASTKTEDALTDLQSEIQNSYASKAETANLKHTIEQMLTNLEGRLNADNVSKSSNDLEKKVDSLEQKIKDLEQALYQAKKPETRMVKTKKKSNENDKNELGDLFESESEVLNEDRVEELTKLKRTELNEIATSYGLSYKTYPTKSDIANAIAFQEYNNDNDD
jgi:hypothetical protein